ncbi:Kinesin-like protein KAR3 [Diplonema papillatum]|nr:Kinesin-like protein KAR3 [Diplonema papillatum]
MVEDERDTALEEVLKSREALASEPMSRWEAETKALRYKWTQERERRERLEAELQKAHQAASAAARVRRSNEFGNDEAEIETLRDEIERIDAFLSEDGIKTGDRITALRQLRADETLMLKTAHRAKVEAEKTHQALVAEYRKLKAEVLWEKREPIVIMCLKPPAPPGKSGATMMASIVEVASGMPSQRVEIVSAKRKASRHRFHSVLPQHSRPADIAAAASDLIAAAFGGACTALMCISSGSLVAASPSQPLVHAVAKEFFASSTRATATEDWSWRLQLTVVEMKNDVIRDLLNSDREYARAQKAGGQHAIRHSVSFTKGVASIGEAASPVVQDLPTMLKLLGVANKNRAVSPEGALRAHEVYIFKVYGSRGNLATNTSGCFILVDLAVDDDLPVELPPGANPEDSAAVQTALEVRHAERFYVQKSYTLLNLLIDKYTPPHLQQPSLPLPGANGTMHGKKKTSAKHTNFAVGSEVHITGLQAPEFLHLNGALGVVVGKGDGSIADRVLIDVGSDCTLPFLPKNLLPTEAESPARSPKPKANPGSRSSVAGSRRASETPTRPETTPRHHSHPAMHPALRSHLNAILHPCFDSGMIGVLLSLPVEGPEAQGLFALQLAARASRCRLGSLVTNTTGAVLCDL